MMSSSRKWLITSVCQSQAASSRLAEVETSLLLTSTLTIKNGLKMTYNCGRLIALTIFFTAFFLIMTTDIEVVAQTRCSTDSFGNTTCRSSDGTVLRGSTDSFGNETWRDNQGNTYRGQTDSFGNKTYRDNYGNTLRGSTDSFGNETWRDNQGNTIRGTTDSFGDKTYRDSQGSVTRCSTDSFGNQTCR